MATEREYFYRISSLYPPKHLHLRAMKRSQLNLLGVQIQPYTQKLSSTATTLPLPSSPITLTAAWWTPIPPRSPQRHRSVPVPLCWHEQCKIASGWVFSSSEWCFSNVSCPLCLQHCSTQVAPLGYKKEGKRSPIISRILNTLQVFEEEIHSTILCVFELDFIITSSSVFAWLDLIDQIDLSQSARSHQHKTQRSVVNLNYRSNSNWPQKSKFWLKKFHQQSRLKWIILFLLGRNFWTEKVVYWVLMKNLKSDFVWKIEQSSLEWSIDTNTEVSCL